VVNDATNHEPPTNDQYLLSVIRSLPAGTSPPAVRLCAKTEISVPRRNSRGAFMM
jgi:hypothetical protein